MKVLVIGAAGGFGGTIARELVRRGHEVRALMRPGGRRPALSGARVVEGDALDVAALDRAAEGVDAVVWGFHLPYDQWVPGAITAARVTAEVCARRGLTVLFPANVYPLGAGFTGKADERTPLRPRSELGRIRLEIESIFRRATERGARVIVLRAGDYLGPNSANTWFEMMTSRALSNGRLVDPGGHGVPHAWAYLPDVARAGALLLERHRELEPHAVFHFEGYDADAPTMLDAARRALGKPSLGAWNVPWWLLVLISPLSRMLRLLLSVRYLWTEAVVLDGAKLCRTLPEFRVTPLDEAVQSTLAWMVTKATKGGDTSTTAPAAPHAGAERAPHSSASTLA